MSNSRIDRIIYFVIASVFVVTSLVLVRVHRVETKGVGLVANSRKAAQIYHQRIQATETLLKTNHLRLSSR